MVWVVSDCRTEGAWHISSTRPQWQGTTGSCLVHSNISSRIDLIPLGESRYVLIFIDDATRMMYLFMLKTKIANEVRECFLKFRNIFEQDRCRIKSIRTDRSGQYRKQMEEFCNETGIHHEETVPIYTRTKRHCRTGKLDDLQMNLRDLCGHRSPERTMGGNCMRRRRSLKRPN